MTFFEISFEKEQDFLKLFSSKKKLTKILVRKTGY
jgi:hypothetical protein